MLGESMKFDVTATIVTYCNDPKVLFKTIDSFLNTVLNVRLYIVDNSPTRELEHLFTHSRISYYFTGDNRGFGAGHNIVINESVKLGKYHLVLNPDIYYASNQLELMIAYLERHQDVALLMPKVIYPNGELQYLCKLLPEPKDWVFRRFLSFLPSTKKRDILFELRDTGYTNVMNIPYLSGCFMLFKSSVFEEVGLFDEGIFMYGEDADMTRRIHRLYRTVFFPDAVVTHEFEKASHKSFKLLWIHIKAAVYYFNKWGWFKDVERDIINSKTLKELKLL